MPILTAVPVVKETVVILPTGDEVRAWPGEWLIVRDQQTLEVFSQAAFTRAYEKADDVGIRIDGDVRSRIERTLGIGSTETPEHLATAVERSARLVIGDIRIDFTPGQWEHLAHRAGKMGLTVEALVRRVVERTTSEFFTVA